MFTAGKADAEDTGTAENEKSDDGCRTHGTHDDGGELEQGQGGGAEDGGEDLDQGADDAQGGSPG